MDTSRDELTLSTLYRWYGSRWWYAKDVVADLGTSDLPPSVAASSNPHMALGRWLGYRRDRVLEGGWLVEADSPPNTADAVRWRVVPDLL